MAITTASITLYLEADNIAASEGRSRTRGRNRSGRPPAYFYPGWLPQRRWCPERSGNFFCHSEGGSHSVGSGEVPHWRDVLHASKGSSRRLACAQFIGEDANFVGFLYILRMDPKQFVDTLVVLMPLLYAGLVVLYGLSFFRTAPFASRLKTPALVATLVVHLGYLSLRTIAFDHPPITSMFEIMTILAACIAIGYTYIELRTKSSNTGFFILILAFAFQTVSSLFIKNLTKIPEYLHSMVLGFHVSAALLGYTAISLSAVYGFLYLMLYHEIKSTRFGLIYARLPNLEMLETMTDRAEMFGFQMLSVAIAIGVFWLPRVFDQFSYWDPKLVGTFVIWLLYAAGLGAKRKFGWQGPKMMVFSLVAFGIVFLSMTVINVWLSGFHKFF
jgi:ABC-type uncharacterized transport system permease subunit